MCGPVCIRTGTPVQKHGFVGTDQPIYSKTCQKRPLSKYQKLVFKTIYRLMQVKKYCRMLQGEHSAILSTCIKLPFVNKIFVLSIYCNSISAKLAKRTIFNILASRCSRAGYFMSRLVGNPDRDETAHMYMYYTRHGQLSHPFPELWV